MIDYPFPSTYFKHLNRGFSGWILILLIGMLKKWDAFWNPQFWAEDSTIYFYDAFTYGWSSILMPYSGYLQVLPRFLAWFIVEVFPLKLAPILFNSVGLLIGTTCLWAFSVKEFRFLIQQDWLRFLLVLITAYVHPAIEITACLTNTFWYLGVGSLLLILYPYKTIMGRVIGFLLLLLVFLSCPLMLQLAPIALLFVLIGNTQLRIQAGVYLIFAAIQAYLNIFKASTAPHDILQFGLFFSDTLELLRITLNASLLNYSLTYKLQNNAYILSWFLAVGALAFPLVVLILNRKYKQILVWGWLLTSVITLLFSLRVYRSIIFLPDPTLIFLAQPFMDNANLWPWRYLFTPYLLILFGYAYTMKLILENGRGQFRKIVLTASLILIIYNIIAVPRWGRLEDDDWDIYTSQLETGWTQPLEIPMNPRPANWTLRIPVNHPRNSNSTERLPIQMD